MIILQSKHFRYNIKLHMDNKPYPLYYITVQLINTSKILYNYRTGIYPEAISIYESVCKCFDDRIKNQNDCEFALIFEGDYKNERT